VVFDRGEYLMHIVYGIIVFIITIIMAVVFIVKTVEKMTWREIFEDLFESFKDIDVDRDSLYQTAKGCIVWMVGFTLITVGVFLAMYCINGYSWKGLL
jgi:hypothetical protein